MQGLIIDYAGVLDTGAEDEKRWKTLIAAVKEKDIAVGILSNEEGDGEALAEGERQAGRARELQDEIRRRSGEPERPRDERDYLGRLLDRF